MGQLNDSWSLRTALTGMRWTQGCSCRSSTVDRSSRRMGGLILLCEYAGNRKESVHSKRDSTTIVTGTSFLSRIWSSLTRILFWGNQYPRLISDCCSSQAPSITREILLTASWTPCLSGAYVGVLSAPERCSPADFWRGLVPQAP